LVTKNAWKTPPRARPNRDSMAIYGRKPFLVSYLGWLLEAECKFGPRLMTNLDDRTRLIDCLALISHHFSEKKGFLKYLLILDFF